MQLSLKDLIRLICQAASVDIAAANKSLEELGLDTNQARNSFRTRLRQQLAKQQLFVENSSIPVDSEVTLRGIAQTLEFSVHALTGEVPTLRFGGPSDLSVPNHAVRRVFFATDRKPTGNSAPAKAFGSERGDGSLTFGSCEVSIPRDHRLSSLESPRIWRFEFRENPDRHVVLLSASPVGERHFYTEVSEALGTGKEAFVFVHGYNVSFADAARRTAQLAYDLAFPGAPVFYSWPSFHSPLSYSADETVVEWSIPHLRTFLASLKQRTGAARINLIAHSMGNRALTRALEYLSTNLTAPAFHQVVLTAPDMDRAVFLQLADAIRKTGERVTLYASTRDLALQAAQFLHRGTRAGESGEDIVVIDGIDTVDASAVDASFLGHSYFGGNRSVVADIFTLIRNGYPPESRFGLQRVDWLGRCYWKFAP